MCAEPWIRGFTTNPTLMRQAGVPDYESFARELLELVPDRPISFEVIADEPGEMERQARRIASWGDNVYVKVPITTTDGTNHAQRPCAASPRDGVKMNVTALMTLEQVRGRASLAGRRPGRVRLGVRGPHRRLRSRPGADHGLRGGAPRGTSP